MAGRWHRDTPACEGTPCGSCWRRRRGVHAHASQQPTRLCRISASFDVDAPSAPRARARRHDGRGTWRTTLTGMGTGTTCWSTTARAVVQPGRWTRRRLVRNHRSKMMKRPRAAPYFPGDEARPPKGGGHRLLPPRPSPPRRRREATSKALVTRRRHSSRATPQFATLRKHCRPGPARP